MRRVAQLILALVLATDRAPGPGEFLYLTQGMLRVDELIVTFTILSNVDEDALLDHTLGMLKTAAQVHKAP